MPRISFATVAVASVTPHDTADKKKWFEGAKKPTDGARRDAELGDFKVKKILLQDVMCDLRFCFHYFFAKYVLMQWSPSVIYLYPQAKTL